ncbi:3143_t:CDS:2, partial [Racocetra fulgida]
ISGCRLISSSALEKLAETHYRFQGIHLNVEPRFDIWEVACNYDKWIKSQFYRKCPTFTKIGRPGLYRLWPTTAKSSAQQWQISNKSIQIILQGSFQTLKYLSLGNQSLSRETATIIASCKTLTQLDLSGTNLDNVSLQDILSHTNQLVSLKLLDLELSNMTLIVISLLKNLRQLHFSVINKGIISSKTIAEMLKCLRKLDDFRMNQIMIGEVDRVITEGLAWVVCDESVEDEPVEDDTKTIHQYDSHGDKSVQQDRAPIRYLDLSPKLDIYPRCRERSMQIEHYISISNYSLQSLAVNHPFLVSFRLVNPYAINAEGVDALLSVLNCLEIFELRWRRAEVDQIHKLTPKFCPKLREMILHGVDIADFDVWFGEHKDLEVDQCENEISFEGRSEVIFKNLEILDLVDASGPTLNNVAPTAYEVDKDYWSLKTTIDDIRAKYGLGGGTRIKDPNLDQNSDLDLEIDLTVADIKKIVKIQQLLEKAAQDLSFLVSASPPEIFSDPNSIKDDDVAVKANVKKALWLVEDDDMSGNAEEAIKSFKENRVAGNVVMNAYTLEDGKDENPPVGFRQDLYQ